MNTWAYIVLGAFLVLLAGLTTVAALRSRGTDIPLIGDGSDEFDGTFTLSFERSAFVPCRKPNTRYWLAWPPDVKLMDEISRLGFDSSFAEVHVRFQGKLETGSPNGYGHLGQYSGQVTVTKLREVSRDGRCK